MKNYKLHIGMLLVALLSLASCQEKEEFGNVVRGSFSLMANIENNETRTSVDEAGNVTWVETDAIGVFGKQTKNAKFQSTGVGASVKFVGEMSTQDEPALAYYPYNESASLDGNTLHFTLPSEYKYTGESNAPMLGIKQENDSFAFKHLCGLLKVTIDDMPVSSTKFVITSKGNMPLPISGVAKVEDVTVDNAIAELQSLPDAYSITYSFTPTVFSTDKVFYIPLPKGTYERLVVSLIGSEDDVLFERSISNLKVERASMIEMPITGCEEGVSYTLADDVFPIIKSDENYITSVNGNKITYNSSIPTDRRPQIGQILLYSDVTEKFPMGFWGKVKSLSEIEGGFVIETETAKIEETFKDLKLNKVINIFEGNNGIELNVTPAEPMHSKGISSLDGVISIPVNGQYTESINDKSFWSVNFQGNVNLISQLGLHILIENKYIKIFDVILKGELGATLEKLSIGVNLGYKNNPISQVLKEFRKLLPPIVISPLVVIPNILTGLYSSAEVGAEINIPLQLNMKSEVKVPLVISAIMPSLRIPHSEIDLGWEQKDFGFKLNGMLGIGPGYGLGMILYGVCPIDVVISHKWAAKGEMELFPKSSYSTLKNTKLLHGAIHDLTASIGLGFSDQLKTSLSISSGDEFMVEKYILPTINNMKFDGYNNEVKNAVISYEVNNSALLKHKHSLGIYEKGKCIEYSHYSDNYTDDSQGKLIYTLKGLEAGKTYKARAEIRSDFGGGLAWHADSLEFIVPENIEVITGKVTDISYHTASFEGIVKGLNFESDFSFGIFCSLENEPKFENSVKVESDKIKDGIFVTSTSQLKENEFYFYRAYVYKDGQYYYGETKSFTTESLNVVTKEYSDLTNSSVVLSGLIEGVKDISNYGICYSTNETPTTSNGTTLYSTNMQENGSFTVQVTSLEEGQTYYYRAFVKDGGNYVYGDIKSFTTKKTKEKFDSLREALIYLYNTTGGENWNRNTNWCSDMALEYWDGIGIDVNGYHINLFENNLNGQIDITFPDDVRLELNVGNNFLTSVDVSGSTSLFRLGCSNILSGTKLISLSVEGCTSLKSLSCGYNQLTSLEVSGLPALETLSCENNQLTSLDVSSCKSLRSLTFTNNPITSIDVSNCTSLEKLDCYRYDSSYQDFMLNSLNVSGCVSLKELSCDGHNLTSLDISSCISLEFLSCMYNKLTSLDYTNCTSLKQLRCSSNNITSEIPDWTPWQFWHDARYTYWEEKDENGEYVTKYKDNGVGWWYRGEPESGKHKP